MPIVASQSKSVRASEIAWQAHVRQAIRRGSELCQRLGLAAAIADDGEPAEGDFATFVPAPYFERIQPGDPNDPLLLQVLPRRHEVNSTPGFTLDAVEDLKSVSSPGVIHKYPGRVLLITTGACAVHCRYCFRKHFPYETGPRTIEQWESALQSVSQDPSIEEVILSGGDPLMLPDSKLSSLVHRIEQITHVQRLRIHTRLPIVIPQRVTDELLDTMMRSRLTPIVVVHANHWQELDASVAEAMGKLVRAGIPVLNQSVLLRGINDSPETLVRLSKTLIQMRCIPYYLHQLDRVVGTEHFEVPIERGLQIVDQMRRLLPGYAVPRYVREVPGEQAKCALH